MVGRRVSDYGAPKTYDQPADNASLCVFAPDLFRLMSPSVRHRRVKTLLVFAFRSFLLVRGLFNSMDQLLTLFYC